VRRLALRHPHCYQGAVALEAPLDEEFGLCAFACGPKLARALSISVLVAAVTFNPSEGRSPGRAGLIRRRIRLPAEVIFIFPSRPLS